MSAVPTLSVIIPIYNEAEVIPVLVPRLRAFLEQLAPRLDDGCELVLIDDGSRDGSSGLLREHLKGFPFPVSLMRFSRNFGHQAAITAGYDLARGAAVVTMDADLQDPPELVLDMVAKWREGCDVVYAVRRKRAGETWFKKVTAWGFYRVVRSLTPVEIPTDVGDFRLVDRKVVEVIRTMRERDRFMRGMFAWTGFRTAGVLFDRPERAAGETKYPLRKMLRLAIDGILSMSVIPLRLAMYLGLAVSLLAFVIGLWAVATKVLGGHTVDGWTSLIVVVAFLSGVQLMVLGIIGEYLGRIYEQGKGRPLYIVSEGEGPAWAERSRTGG